MLIGELVSRVPCVTLSSRFGNELVATAQGSKIQAVKRLREATGPDFVLGLRESKNVIENLMAGTFETYTFGSVVYQVPVVAVMVTKAYEPMPF